MNGKQRQRDRTRDKILDALADVIAESGGVGFSIQQVADRAGVTHRTVYNHFPSKEELFEAILLLMWERSQSPDELAYTPTRPLRDQLLELLAQKMRLLNDASFIDLSRVAMADMMHTPERARGITAKLSAKEEGLPRWLRAAQQDGRLRATMDVPYAAPTQEAKSPVKKAPAGSTGKAAAAPGATSARPAPRRAPAR